MGTSKATEPSRREKGTVLIIVVGSRHDPVAVSLAASWPNAALLSAEDLTSEGWTWTGDGGAQRWVVAGRTLDDSSVSGVFVRRSAVLPAELTHVHPDDRAYLAAETQAFLIAMLGSTAATVVNPVGDGAMGDELIRPEQWMVAAAAVGLSVRPLTLTRRALRSHEGNVHTVEVVGARAFGDTPDSLRRSAVELVGSLSLAWALCVFDSQGCFIALTTAATPSAAASEALADLLERKAS